MLKLAGMDEANLDRVGPTNPESIIDGAARARRPSPYDALIAEANGGGPATDEERREVLEELDKLGAFPDHE